MSLFFKKTKKEKTEEKQETVSFKPLKISMTEELYRRKKEEDLRKKYTRGLR